MTGASRGAFIVVEGIDRTGKSTQCKLLAKALNERNISAKEMKFPDRTTTIGTMIDAYLKKHCDIDDHAIHLLFSANRWEMSNKIKTDLLNGITLVVDRYAFSGVAYSSAKPGMDIAWCKQCDIGLPQPDLVMYLQLSAEEAQRRSGFGEERYEKKEFQKRVLGNFSTLHEPGFWKTIDATESIEEMHKNMVSLTEKVLDEVKDKVIRELWSNESTSN